ncbi:YtxH domain-containing protein [Lacticaseibacillus parakribbianus]|uniref:YtxH domain-containing protein n=1 Tax=Lacticaseibacillus parakribbianus TaxID=2970927 RepID=UPI0021CAF063|nr:YtxH domain-containing protein [Lacticaseibacillus parakribbianus]
MSKKSHFLLGFVLGAASSLAATYLLTPQTSSDLKKKFATTKDDLADRAADYYDYAKDATAEWRDSATALVADLKAKAQKPEDAVANYDQATASLKDQLTAVPEVGGNDDFDDIVLDGKSAFAQAKDQADAPVADAEGPEMQAADEPDTPVDAAEPAADEDSKD